MSEITRHQTPLVHGAYDRNFDSFSAMAEEALEVQGYELAKDDVADALEGVPFLITKVTFRPGFPDPSNKARKLAFVSCEIVIADEEFLSRRKKSLDGKPFLPGDHVVLNDGSTGVYRQVVAALETAGYIELPEGPTEGSYPTTRYDTPPGEWTTIHVGTRERGEVGTSTEGFDTYECDVRILAPRGLRISEYSNDYTADGKTRYLA